jgi:hypothetical protein
MMHGRLPLQQSLCWTLTSGKSAILLLRFVFAGRTVVLRPSDFFLGAVGRFQKKKRRSGRYAVYITPGRGTYGAGFSPRHPPGGGGDRRSFETPLARRTQGAQRRDKERAGGR